MASEAVIEKPQGKVVFSYCGKCNEDILKEQTRKRVDNRISSSGWAHASCFEIEDIPIPTLPIKEVSNGNGSGAHGIQAIADILKPFIKNEAQVSQDMIASLVKEEVSKLSLVRTFEVKLVSGETVKIENPHYQFDDLLKLVTSLRTKKNVYLFGPAGTGKSTVTRQIAEALKLKWGYVSLGKGTPESRLFGYMSAGGVFIETELYRFYRDGGVYCIDEMDNASPSLLNMLNSLLENGHGAFPCGTITRHPDFYLIGTGNTNGRGATIEYPNRTQFETAFMERFYFVFWGIDEDLEKSITLSINPEAGAWLKWVRDVRAYVKEEQIALSVSPRASIDGADILRSFTPSQVADMIVWRGLDYDTKVKIVQAHPLPKAAR